jgi:hypothetical protein
MITHTLTSSFIAELHDAIHGFDIDVIKLALYDSNATLGKTTTAYSATNEVSGTGYVAGGMVLVASSSMRTWDVDTFLIDWENPLWAAATISARGGLIYNSSKANRSICVLDFGRVVSSTGNDFVFQFPAPTKGTCLIKSALR